MSELTLLLTRKPDREFVYLQDRDGNEEEDDLTDDQRDDVFRQFRQGTRTRPATTPFSGRWGTMAMINGPKISCAWFVPTPPAGAPAVQLETNDFLVRYLGISTSVRTQTIRFADRYLKVLLEHDSDVIQEPFQQYTTMEAFRDPNGRLGNHGTVQLHPSPFQPYEIHYANGYDKIVEMRPNGGNIGEYVKINGSYVKGDFTEMSELEQAILIHEAVNVTWLTGCISPRPYGNTDVFKRLDPDNLSARAVREILTALRRQPGERGSLFVLDW